MTDDDLDAGAKDRFYYTARSLQNAFGDPNPASFDPTLGFAPNRGRMVQIYNYYQSLYQKKPDLFLWAGLGHLAGANIVSGLDMVLSQNAEGDHPYVGHTAKQIFLDLAWLHEAFLDDPQTAISLAGTRDSVAPTPAASYAQAWSDIASLDPARVAAGNQALLRNEQFCLVQAGMDALRASDPPYFSKTSALYPQRPPLPSRFHYCGPDRQCLALQRPLVLDHRGRRHVGEMGGHAGGRPRRTKPPGGPRLRHPDCSKLRPAGGRPAPHRGQCRTVIPAACGRAR
jgi:hypothetical protein